MNRNTRQSLFPLVSLLAAVQGCSKDKASFKAPEDDRPAPEPRAVYQARPEPPAAVGDVYIRTSDNTIRKMSAEDPTQGFEVVAQAPLIDTFEVIADGVLFAGFTPTTDPIVLLRKGEARGFSADLGAVSDFTVDKDGRTWILGSEGLGELVGDKVELKKPLLPGLGPDAVITGPEGNLWLIGSRKSLRLKGADWQDVEDIPSETTIVFHDGAQICFVEEKREDPTLPIATYSLRCLQNDGWKTTHQDIPWAEKYAISVHGDLRAVKGTILTLHDGKADKEVVLDRDEGTTVGSLVVDDRGRTWLATDAGILVIDRLGERRAFWPTASLPGLQGTVEQLFVMKGGPKELPKAGEVIRGSVIGQLQKEDGSPLANASVEICDKPAGTYQHSPCNDRSSQHYTSADADGRFVFEDVSKGAYGMAVRAEDSKFFTVLHPSCCTNLQAGSTLDLGLIKYSVFIEGTEL